MKITHVTNSTMSNSPSYTSSFRVRTKPKALNPLQVYKSLQSESLNKVRIYCHSERLYTGSLTSEEQSTVHPFNAKISGLPPFSLTSSNTSIIIQNGFNPGLSETTNRYTERKHYGYKQDLTGLNLFI